MNPEQVIRNEIKELHQESRKLVAAMQQALESVEGIEPPIHPTLANRLRETVRGYYVPQIEVLETKNAALEAVCEKLTLVPVSATNTEG